MPKKEASAQNANILGVSGLNAKSVTGINVHQNADVLVIEISFSGGSTFIKSRKGIVKVGGSEEWETGTVIFS